MLRCWRLFLLDYKPLSPNDRELASMGNGLWHGRGFDMARAFCTVTSVQENADGTLSVYYETKYSDAAGEVVEMDGLVQATETLASGAIADLIESTVIDRILADQPSGWGLVAADVLLVGVQ